MDRARAEAMHGYFLSCRLLVAVGAWLEGLTTGEDVRCFADTPGKALTLALDDEHAAVEECLAEGVTLEELDALAAMAGSRFAPAWARERFEVIG